MNTQMTSETTSLIPLEDTSKQIVSSLQSLFKSYEEKLVGIKKIADFMTGRDGLLHYFTKDTGMSLTADRLFRFENAKNALDAEYWSMAIEMTQVLEYMSAGKRNEWHEMIHDRKTPSFDREAVIETIQNWLMSRGEYLSEKVDGIFRKLSGDHVTNSPMGFRKRMIISYVVDDYGFINHDRAEYVHDLRSVIAKLLNRNEPRTRNTHSDLRRITSNNQFGEWQEFDGGAFKVRLYKVGTAHLEVHPEIAVKLNKILAAKNPAAIASSAQKISKKEKSIPLYNEILPYAVTEELSSVTDSVCRGRTFLLSHDLPEGIKKEVERVLSFLGATSTRTVWSFPYDASEVLIKVVRTGCLPEKVSHQFYPTKKELAARVVRMLEVRDTDKILEPSAGHGAIAELLPKTNTTCIEVSEINSSILRQKGLSVITTDFLKWNPSPRMYFNKIVMNPPFTKGQAEAHVKKAAELLQENGMLVAILPASLKDRVLVDGMHHAWGEVIEGAFEETGARVVILELINTA